MNTFLKKRDELTLSVSQQVWLSSDYDKIIKKIIKNKAIDLETLHNYT